ncbi:hypothetical protein NU08_2935 [Flavobacterium anhuiense]|uniref:Uncharacterized protein n=1 Tax=Flavobacterium anhuiense TaxID=459526 RepID=A0A444VWW4_9FLAO|nr:hypothetical protein [Flavobacterium anhuiense]RYJ38032.1 hypothetical protein NU08_2935 [Flavobacterium anhuiense]
MTIKYKYTKYQVARTAKADAFSNNKWYLIKCCDELRATYQIKILLSNAISKKGKLIVKVKKECLLKNDLKQLMKENKSKILCKKHSILL